MLHKIVPVVITSNHSGGRGRVVDVMRQEELLLPALLLLWLHLRLLYHLALLLKIDDSCRYLITRYKTVTPDITALGWLLHCVLGGSECLNIMDVIFKGRLLQDRLNYPLCIVVLQCWFLLQLLSLWLAVVLLLQLPTNWKEVLILPNNRVL